MDLDAATENAKNAGRMKQEAKKSVGVISFYGEQVKRIDRLIQQELIPAAFDIAERDQWTSFKEWKWTSLF